MLAKIMKTAIVILGGGLVEENGKWRTTNFEEKGDKFGALGDRLRVVAGSFLWQDFPQSKIVCSGGKGQLKDREDAPTVASVLSEELAGLGVSGEDIIKEEESGNTAEQLEEALNIVENGGFDKVIIVSNEYHLPRVKTMIENFSGLKGYSNHEFELKPAEKILVEHDPEAWAEAIKRAYEGDDMKKRIALEEQGICDIKEGRYKIS